jgi:hypothetical protein
MRVIIVEYQEGVLVGFEDHVSSLVVAVAAFQAGT